MRPDSKRSTSATDTDRAIFERERALARPRVPVPAHRARAGHRSRPSGLGQGSTPEEIDASIEEIKQRSESISPTSRAANEPQPFRGAAMPSVPPVGPMEQLPSYETLTPEVIGAMDIDTYKRIASNSYKRLDPQRQRGR